MNHGRALGVLPILFSLFSLTAFAKDYPAVPGEYVVKMKNTTAIMSMSAFANQIGAEVKRTVSQDLGLVLVKRSTIETQESAVQTLASNPMVEYAEPNYIYRANGHASALPADPEFTKLWGMQNTGQTVTGDGGTFHATPGIDIDAARAWGITTGSKKIVVAVIDTGVNYENPDLAQNIWTNQAELNGVKGVDDDNNGYVDDIHGYDFAKKDGDPMDVYGHGTHCSGTIGARANDGVGVAGVAWDVQIMPVRFLGDDGGGNLADAVSSIEYAIKMKANIMSNSWGGGGYAQALYDVIKKARDNGILFIAAAGNESNDNDSTPSYPASYQVDNVLTVAAVDPNGQIADFSNFGKTSVHVAAPGVDILSHTMKKLESWSGTSMATPHVTGIAVLLLSQDMNQTYSQIKQRIMASARPLASLRSRVSTGGIANAYYALTNSTAPADENDPFNWAKSSQAGPSTEHPYKNTAKQSWTLSYPGAKQVAVYFSKFETEGTYDKVVFTDKNGKKIATMSGKLGEVFGPVVDGDTVTMTFSSDSSNTEYGFDVGGLAYR